MTTEHENALGKTLERLRDKHPRPVFADTIGVHPNTLALYERGERLPELDFLATFADKTGADFNELLRLRLASGKTEEARKLAETYQDVTENKEKYEGAQRQVAHEDFIRDRFFNDQEAAKRNAERLQSVGAKLRETRQGLEKIEGDLGYTPPAQVHHAILTLMVKYNLSAEDIALLLNALSTES
jgi:transcriptional regulator with XRE-family HTH domain